MASARWHPQRQHGGQPGEEGLELVADGGPQVAGGVHGQGLHEGGNVLQAVQHSAPCWQALLVVQTLQDGGITGLHNEDLLAEQLHLFCTLFKIVFAGAGVIVVSRSDV